MINVALISCIVEYSNNSRELHNVLYQEPVKNSSINRILARIRVQNTGTWCQKIRSFMFYVRWSPSVYCRLGSAVL